MRFTIRYYLQIPENVRDVDVYHGSEMIFWLDKQGYFCSFDTNNHNFSKLFEKFSNSLYVHQYLNNFENRLHITKLLTSLVTL